MKAVIFSHNEGNRLRPVTCTTPKALLPLMDKSIIEHMIMLLLRNNIQDITIVADYLLAEIENHLRSRDLKDATLNFAPRQNLGNFFADEDTLLISDSTVTDMDFGKFIQVFKDCGHALFAVQSGAESFEYGSVRYNEKGLITSYIPCPDFAHPVGLAVSGIAAIPRGTSVKDANDIPSLLQKLTENDMTAYACISNCYTNEISDFESYKKCIRDFMDKKINLPISCPEKAPSVWVDENATVMQGSVIVPPVFIGSGSVISKGARIESYSQIGKNVNVGCLAGIKRSIVMDDADIGDNASVRAAIIGHGSKLGFESALYENSVISDKTTVGKHSTVRTGVHIWPDKVIGDEVIVSENIIWGNSSSPTLFEDGCAEGILNHEITPEFSIALARGTTSLLGKKIAVSCDGGGKGSMIKNALISGIQSSGGVAYDMGEQPLPITRSGIAFYKLDGGIALSTEKREGKIFASLDIINSCGSNIDDEALNKLRHLTQRGIETRALGEDISEAEYLFEYKLYYLKQLINEASKKPLRKKLLIHCLSRWACELLKSAADDLGCEFRFFASRDREEFIKSLKDGDYDFGAICDYKCETLTLVTKEGEIVSPFNYCALTSLIIMKSFPSAQLFVPQFAPESIDVLAEKYTASVFRTGINSSSLMNELSKDTHKIFLHQFIYRFDAVGAIILLCDFLSGKNLTVQALLGEIPPSHIVSTDVPCNIDEQKNVLTALCSQHSIDTPAQGDAIKVDFEKGWVLIIPKRTKAAINIISHAQSTEYAREIADIITDDLSRH